VAKVKRKVVETEYLKRPTLKGSQQWNDEHADGRFSFSELTQLLKPYFEVHHFEHDYEKKITPLG